MSRGGMRGKGREEKGSVPEGEEVLDLLVLGLLADVLDMDGGSHDDGQ